MGTLLLRSLSVRATVLTTFFVMLRGSPLPLHVSSFHCNSFFRRMWLVIAFLATLVCEYDNLVLGTKSLQMSVEGQDVQSNHFLHLKYFGEAAPMGTNNDCFRSFSSFFLSFFCSSEKKRSVMGNVYMCCFLLLRFHQVATARMLLLTFIRIHIFEFFIQ